MSGAMLWTLIQRDLFAIVTIFFVLLLIWISIGWMLSKIRNEIKSDLKEIKTTQMEIRKEINTGKKIDILNRRLNQKLTGSI